MEDAWVRIRGTEKLQSQCWKSSLWIQVLLSIKEATVYIIAEAVF
jgi:hypothetical protein